MTEEIMTGGVNQVVRTGDLVRRPAGLWAPLVHDLLRAVREHGFTAAPGEGLKIRRGGRRRRAATAPAEVLSMPVSGWRRTGTGP